MEEANIADNVVIIDAGKIVAEGSPLALKNKYASDFIKAYKYDKKLLSILENANIPYKKDKSYLEIVKGSRDDVFLSVTGKNLKENV